ncbi:beta-ketoacyl synthase N-terminal-like domain-containing protein [Burkholderia gladioli]|uniref:beta-ketoacyl synthase N-terminal-like domain-containing protein n=1 Tax=Burkholderia gladioli TaxID=28095 RepID=UPI00163F7F87|nr:polyketide synthase [Burkholderia gladioli]
MADNASTGRDSQASVTDRQDPRAAAASVPDGWAPAGYEPVAIVGMACRMPGAANKEQFWDALRAGRDCITAWPRRRLPVVASRPAQGAKEGGFLDGVDEFDAGFFHISPKEAQRMDPQQRLLLELAWEALEDAGCPASTIRHTDGGVFVGISHSDYSQNLFSGTSPVDSYSSSANAISISANRLSFCLDLTGPSIAIDTACSSSLTAAHLACTSLREGECGFALVAGVNLVLAPELTSALELAGILSPDFRCKPFSARANGYVRGEGCGVVVMKRLARAVADGDRIYAVIRGSAVGQNGRSNGLTSPNPGAQESVMRAAARRAAIDPNKIDYVETHGTGTHLGDQIELLALSRVYCDRREPIRPLLLGAVKSNIGHLEAAAGMAGLIKTSLALHHGELPGNLHVEPPNESIDFAASRIEVLGRTRGWPDTGRAKAAGLSSFGFGGANAHLILGEAPRLPARPADGPGTPQLVVLSAETAGALLRQASRLSAWLDAAQSGAGHPLSDLAYSLLARRDALRFRRAFVAATAIDLAAQLARFAGACRESDLTRAARVRAAFWFGEPGCGWIEAMGAACGSDPHLRSIVELGDERLRAGGQSWSIAGSLGSRAALRTGAKRRAAAIAVQLGLIHALRAHGVTPSLARGIGAGRIAAGMADGSSTLEQALDALTGDETAGDASPAGDPAPDEGARTVWFVCGGRLPARYQADAAAVIELSGDGGAGALLDALATWYGVGGSLCYRAVEGVEPRLVSLPAYPWERTRYWFDASAVTPVAARRNPPFPAAQADSSARGAGDGQALSALETSLLSIWETVVGVSAFGVTERLLRIGKPAHITQFQAEIAKRLGKSISLDKLTRSPTIRDLARTLEVDTEDRLTLQSRLSRGAARRNALARSQG